MFFAAACLPGERVFLYTETMKRISTSLAGIALLALLPACDSHDSDGADEPARSSEVSLVERFNGQLPVADTLAEASESKAEFSVASVNGRVRLVREELLFNAASEMESATNTYLYFEDQPVYYQSSASFGGDETARSHRLDAYVEFGVDGSLIGAEKRVDGERVPLADEEITAVMTRGLDLLEASRALQAPDFCDYNKTLRWRDVLATVSVPQGENCAAGRLRIFAQSGKRTLALDTRRQGIVAESWIGDFSGDGKAEILVAIAREISKGNAAEQGELLAFRAAGDMLKPVDIAPLDPAQLAIHGGQDMFRVHDEKLIRRFPRSDVTSAPGSPGALTPRWERLTYDWQEHEWMQATAPDRDGWPDSMQGSWTDGDGSELLLEPDGGISGKGKCNRFSGGSLRFPGNIVLIRPLTSTRMACPEGSAGSAGSAGPLDDLSGFWFAERVGEELRLSLLGELPRHESQSSDAAANTVMEATEIRLHRAQATAPKTGGAPPKPAG